MQIGEQQVQQHPLTCNPLRAIDSKQCHPSISIATMQAQQEQQQHCQHFLQIFPITVNFQILYQIISIEVKNKYE